MNKKRISRINEEIKKIVSSLIINGIKDPRLDRMVSVTEVSVTNDLRYATIYISVLGNDKEKEDVIEGLESAKGFIRKEIGSKIDLRYSPEPKFVLDETMEKAIDMSKKIEELNRGNNNE